MTARDEAIEAAERAVAIECAVYADPPITEFDTDHLVASALAAAVPVLLNDLADRIEAGRGRRATTDATSSAAALVRAAAEGWGE